MGLEWMKMTRAQLNTLHKHLRYDPEIEYEGLNLIVSYEKNVTYNSDQIENDMVSIVFRIEPSGEETKIRDRRV